MSGAILFPGQGAQAHGMGMDIVGSDPAASKVFDEASEILNVDLRAQINSVNPGELDRTDVCQPAILATSIATLEALTARGIVHQTHVTAVAGLSLGEYTALCYSGALSLEDALRLVQVRGQAMQAASDQVQSGMCSLIGVNAQTAAHLCDEAKEGEVLLVANHLGEKQVAIAGTAAAIERAKARAKDHGVRKVVDLPVAGAFHSPCMEPAAKALNNALDEVTLREPCMDIYMNVTGKNERDPAELKEGLRRQLTSPVLWHPTMLNLIQAGITQVMEPAPGKQLSNMARRYDEAFTITSCETLDSLQSIESWPSPSGESS